MRSKRDFFVVDLIFSNPTIDLSFVSWYSGLSGTIYEGIKWKQQTRISPR